MKLRPFDIKKELTPYERESRRRKMFLFSIFGLCLFTILLNKSLSMYQINNEANVTDTKVGNFTNVDIKLVPYINGEKSNIYPSNTSGYIFEKIECTEKAVGDWNKET